MLLDLWRINIVRKLRRSSIDIIAASPSFGVVELGVQNKFFVKQLLKLDMCESLVWKEAG